MDKRATFYLIVEWMLETTCLAQSNTQLRWKQWQTWKEYANIFLISCCLEWLYWFENAFQNGMNTASLDTDKHATAQSSRAIFGYSCWMGAKTQIGSYPFLDPCLETGTPNLKLAGFSTHHISWSVFFVCLFFGYSSSGLVWDTDGTWDGRQ